MSARAEQSAERRPAGVAVPLAEFQRHWVLDDARMKLWVKSRRIGGTFAATLEIALDMVENAAEWTMISRAQFNARELIRETRNHLEAMNLAAGALKESAEDSDLLGDDKNRLQVMQLRLPNGAICRALSAHPDAGRGFGGNFFLDEFAAHRDSIELWKGVAPAIMRGHKLRVVSTPKFRLGKFYELARQCGLSDAADSEFPRRGKARLWSWHRTTLEQAIPELAATGVHVSLEEMRELADDEETFRQEFGCEFLSAAEMWIGPELIAAARSGLATVIWDPLREVEGELYAGMDIGRKKDRTVIWIDEVFDNKLAITRGVITMRDTPFVDQLRAAISVAKHRKLRRFCVDSTGLGAMLAEELQRLVGSKIEPVVFTQASKEEMAVLARRRFEERLNKIPEDSPEIERALAAIKRQATVSGSLRFDAERSEAGHADHAWAKFLADRAADSRGACGPAPEHLLVGEMTAFAQAGGY